MKKQPIVKVFNHFAGAKDHFIAEGPAKYGYQLYEGAGTDGGRWMVKGNGEQVMFNNRSDAEEHIEHSEASFGDRAHDRAPRVRVFNHRAKDGIDIIGRSAGGSFFIGKNASGKFVVGGVRQKDGPGVEVEFEDLRSAQNHYDWLVKEYD